MGPREERKPFAVASGPAAVVMLAVAVIRAALVMVALYFVAVAAAGRLRPAGHR